MSERDDALLEQLRTHYRMPASTPRQAVDFDARLAARLERRPGRSWAFGLAAGLAAAGLAVWIGARPAPQDAPEPVDWLSPALGFASSVGASDEDLTAETAVDDEGSALTQYGEVGDALVDDLPPELEAIALWVELARDEVDGSERSPR